MSNQPPDMPHGLNLPALRYLASRKRVHHSLSVPLLKKIDAAARTQGVSRTAWLELAAVRELARFGA